jgi:hypothetical protein
MACLRLGGCRRPAANPAADADHDAGNDQQGHGEDLGQRVDDQGVVGSRQEEVIGQSGRDRGDHPGGASADRGRGHHHEQVEDDDVLQADGAPKGFDEQPDEQTGHKGANGPGNTFSVKAGPPAPPGGHGGVRRPDDRVAAISVPVDGTDLSPPRRRSR